MIWYRSAWLVFGLAALSATGASQVDRAAAPASVRRLFAGHCNRCHRGERPKGELDLTSLVPHFDDATRAAKWTRVLDQLRFGSMPPPNRPRPAPADVAEVVTWIESQLVASPHGDAYRRKLLRPEYGNYVDHDLLFGGGIATPPASPPRLWRKSPEIFAAETMRRHRRLQNPYGYTTADGGIRDYAATSRVDISTVEMIMVNATQIIDSRIEAARKPPSGRRRRTDPLRTFLSTSGPPEDSAIRATVTHELRFLYGNEPATEQVARYAELLQSNVTLGGKVAGLRTTLMAMHLAPEAVFRMELGLGPTDDHGRRRLSAGEVAHALAYALTDRGPRHHPVLGRARAEGDLASAAGVAKTVRAMLDGANATRPRRNRRGGGLPRLRRFFHQFFGYAKPEPVFKDAERQRRHAVKHRPRSIKNDADRLLALILKEDRDVFAELLTTNRFFAAHDGNNAAAHAALEKYKNYDVEHHVARAVKGRLRRRRNQKQPIDDEIIAKIRRNAERVHRAKRARIERLFAEGKRPFPGFGGVNQRNYDYVRVYGLSPATWDPDQPLRAPKEQRAGILTSPAWLTAHSLNDGNDPIRRGKWVRERLLAGVVPDLPPDVDAHVPEAPNLTLRQRMKAVRAERCWGCHEKMNPLGEPFEMYDDFGRHRSHHYRDARGHLVTRRDRAFKKLQKAGKLTVERVDATGHLRGTGDAELDGPVENAVDLMQRLARSDRVRQSFVRHAFRFFLGRNETLGDSRTLIAADEAYVRSGGSFRAVVVSLLSSDSFLYRR